MTSMKMPIVAAWLRQWQRGVWIVVGVTGACGLLLALGQVLAAALAVIVGGLLLEIEQRNARTRMLAQRLVVGHGVEKIEVPRGAWGELCRAINTLVQEQRQQEQLRFVAPQPLPEDTLRALLDAAPPGTGTQRVVAVLLVSCIGVQPARANQRHTLNDWQALAQASQSLAQQHGALLQPCGDAIMLALGALHPCPIDVALASAVAAAQQLRTNWHTDSRRVPLAISITSGVVTVTTLPGLGCCIIGEPVEQAIQIKRLALAAPSYSMLCDESAYFALRRREATWRPTEFRVASSTGHTQVVYGALAATSTRPVFAT